jgi:hypothetical protein
MANALAPTLPHIRRRAPIGLSNMSTSCDAIPGTESRYSGRLALIVTTAITMIAVTTSIRTQLVRLHIARDAFLTRPPPPHRPRHQKSAFNTVAAELARRHVHRTVLTSTDADIYLFVALHRYRATHLTSLPNDVLFWNLHTQAYFKPFPYFFNVPCPMDVLYVYYTFRVECLLSLRLHSNVFGITVPHMSKEVIVASKCLLFHSLQNGTSQRHCLPAREQL